MKPCVQCPVLAMCKSRPLVMCSIVYDQYELNDWEVFDLDLIASYLNKADWSITTEGEVTFYKPIKLSEMKGYTLTSPHTPYETSDGSVMYYEKDGSRDNILHRLPKVKQT